jgi:hypothetical protein
MMPPIGKGADEAHRLDSSSSSANAERASARVRRHRTDAEGTEAPRAAGRARRTSIAEMIASLLSPQLQRAITAEPPIAAGVEPAVGVKPELTDELLATAVITNAMSLVQNPAPSATPSASPASAGRTDGTDGTKTAGTNPADKPEGTKADAATAIQAAAREAGKGIEKLPELTPLEQAVHELIERVMDQRQRRQSDGPAATDAVSAQPLDAASANAAVHAAPATGGHTAPIAAPATPVAIELAGTDEVEASETAVNRLRMVVGDDANKVVVNVAVRGAHVDVTLRASDESTAAALARNLGSLDHALRARGLDLGDRSADHDSEPDAKDPRRSPPRRQRGQEDA